jgi:AraC family transcriptional regulator, regulatory protein of adaptative response / methylated-DNA-[protein]-cysteine methyltransferase
MSNMMIKNTGSLLTETGTKRVKLESNEDHLWEAVVTRDLRFYSSFVYGVKSSGIYCRPSCPSRKPSRDKVEFFPDRSSAETAGYRACLRCEPDSEIDLPSNVATVQRVCNFIEENYDSKISLRKLGEIAGQSQFHFHRSFQKVTGLTPKQYLEAVRLNHVKMKLKLGESARNSTYGVGHNSASWLYSEGATSKLGMSPSIYKSGGEGLSISYTIASCSLGRVLVAATTKGICFVCLGDADEKLVRHLQNEFPKAKILPKGTNEELAGWTSQILKYLEGRTLLEQTSLPLDVTATAFQMRVWRELQRIPHGRTLSYNEVAEKIGNPRAYRAVANACASNRVPLVIPCHRVVRKNGDLGGYRWGVERKKKLLMMEAESISKVENY